MFWKTTSESILPVKKVMREDGELLLKCPHCGEIRGVWDDGDAIGGMYQDNLCDGHYEIDDDVIFVNSVSILEKESCVKDTEEEEEYEEN